MAARGMLTGAATQGIGVATGLQQQFSWTGVAAAGVGAGFGKFVGGGPIISGMAGGIAASAAESLITGNSFGDTLMRNLPGIIGNTVGNWVAGKIAGGGSLKDDIVVNQDAIDRAMGNLPSSVPSIDLDAGLSLDTKLALGEGSGTLPSREAATIRAMAAEIVMGQNLAAAGQGQEGRFQSGAFEKHYGSVSSYSLSSLELRRRKIDFDAFVATLGINPSSQELADISNYRLSLQGDEANLNAALAIANGEVNKVLYYGAGLPAQLALETVTGELAIGTVVKGYRLWQAGRAANGVDDVVRLTPQQAKAKIFGTAQQTGNDGAHAFRSIREAILLARNSEVEAVYLNKGYNVGLELAPKIISPNRRPDVLGRYFDGRVDRVEVFSRTDNALTLRARNTFLDPQIRAKGFAPLQPRVVYPVRK